MYTALSVSSGLGSKLKFTDIQLKAVRKRKNKLRVQEDISEKVRAKKLEAVQKEMNALYNSFNRKWNIVIDKTVKPSPEDR